MNSKKRLNRNLICLLFPLLLTIVHVPALYAMYPSFNAYGWLCLRTENEYAPFTKAKAITSGVEQWYRTWRYEIKRYIQHGEFNTYLPNFSQNCSWTYQHVDARTLAEMIYCTYGLDDTPADVVDEVEMELIDDRGNYTCGWDPTCGRPYPMYIDPYSDWKWRSIYMESMYGENDFTDCYKINANCWGTADYLARDWEWKEKYEHAFPDGASSWKNKFPHIYLDGGKYYPKSPSFPNGQYNEYCIDDDLDPDQGDGNQRAVFRGHRSGYDSYPQPKTLLNSFDVIRLAVDPDLQHGPHDHEMVINDGNINVGYNLHCVAYLCTDASDRAWIYEKHNYGCTQKNPYGINILGDDQWNPPVGGIGMYNYSYCSFFKKYGHNKQNLADNYHLNWAGITE